MRLGESKSRTRSRRKTIVHLPLLSLNRFHMNGQSHRRVALKHFIDQNLAMAMLIF